MPRPRKESRRFPRVAVNGVGAISVSVRGTGSDLTDPDSVKTGRVRIQDVSPEGVGIVASATLDISKRDYLTFHIKLHGTQLNLPARLMWKEHQEGGVVRAGLKLQLELAGHDHRQKYAEWVVAKIRGGQS